LQIENELLILYIDILITQGDEERERPHEACERQAEAADIEADGGRR
jgi:hypothetical protein